MKEEIEIKIATNENEKKEAFKIRELVFQIEQSIPKDLDFDGKDDMCDHFIAYKNDIAVGTGRLRYSLIDTKMLAKVERMAVLPEQRGKGIGKVIMQKMHDYLKEKNVHEVTLHVQQPLKSFYEKFGYEQIGEAFLDADRPHIAMRLEI
jgi:predicted GNAT family N-acyltransferase